MSSTRKTGNAFFAAAGVFVLLGAGGIAAYASQSGDSETAVVTGAADSPAAAPVRISGNLDKVTQAVEKAARGYISGSINITYGDKSISIPRATLGAAISADALNAEAQRVKESGENSLVYEGNLHVPVQAKRDLIEKTVRQIKNDWDTGPVNAHFDLEARKVHSEVPGSAIDLFGSVSAVEVAIRSGAKSVALEGVAVPAAVTVDTLGIADVSTVLGTFTTKFSVAEKTRNDNLKLLASKIDGYVLQPGQEFSFNEITGERRLQDGFKMAHVISQGQMVDGMAGGSCQISSTLHGAAFFSGLDILTVTPHSRPSTYVTLGLDATVVASRVDLKLRNPYDFPVVIHYRVARGESQVEILGKEKPFDSIEFSRNIDERIDFETITREDPEMGMGHMVVDQMGYPGYKLSKIRKIFKDGKVIKTNKWKLRYYPVYEYARLGINPNPNLPAPKTKKGHGPKPASGKLTIRR